MIAMVVHVPGAVRVTALAKIDLSGVEREARRAARAIHFERGAFDGIEKVVVVVAVSVDALAGLQREFPDADALVLENHLGSDFGHGLLSIGGNTGRRTDRQKSLHQLGSGVLQSADRVPAAGVGCDKGVQLRP